MSATTLYCWGVGSPTTLIEGYHNARSVSTNFARTCVVDDDGIWCTGPRAGTAPQLLHPQKVSVGYDHTCALDDEGVKCWADAEGDASLTNIPASKRFYG